MDVKDVHGVYMTMYVEFLPFGAEGLEVRDTQNQAGDAVVPSVVTIGRPAESCVNGWGFAIPIWW